jgi:DNA repair protein RadA/Sms
MAKVKTAFYCQSCGTQYAKWQGQCNSCKQWNTIVEEVIQKPDKTDWRAASVSEPKRASKPLRINEIDMSQEARLNMQDGEFNRVLGGGMVPGSLTLLGGEPGIGKSTLLLQIAPATALQDALCFRRRKPETDKNAGRAGRSR